SFHYQPQNETALVIPLPRPVKQGESVTVEIDFIMHLPQKQGRWGQWQGVTFLSNWLPVLAYYDDQGWQPTLYIPWHQPFFTEAIPVYTQWFGPYPYPEFTVVESYFGWNGNECSGLVMIDERIFGMPHAAAGFVDYLVSHETCHQWWYNVVGTNGYAETWMDEGLATYFGHHPMDQKHGRNSNLLTFPKGLEWLPNIQRETYRTYGMFGTIGRGEAGPTVQEMPRYQHLANLLSMCYDRG